MPTDRAAFLLHHGARHRFHIPIDARLVGVAVLAQFDNTPNAKLLVRTE